MIRLMVSRSIGCIHSDCLLDLCILLQNIEMRCYDLRRLTWLFGSPLLPSNVFHSFCFIHFNNNFCKKYFQYPLKKDDQNKSGTLKKYNNAASINPNLYAFNLNRWHHFIVVIKGKSM